MRQSSPEMKVSLGVQKKSPYEIDIKSMACSITLQTLTAPCKIDVKSTACSITLQTLTADHVRSTCPKRMKSLACKGEFL